MNPNRTTTPWERLTKQAAKAPEQTSALPLGFSTRVISQWKAQSLESAWTMLEWFTWRGVGVATLVLLGCAGLNYEAFFTPSETLAAGETLISFLEP